MSALIVVDLQNDFISGSLVVDGASEIIPLCNNLMDHFQYVVATRDWHPPDHVSFITSYCPVKSVGDVIMINGCKQILWPKHAVRGTWGSLFDHRFEYWKAHNIVEKGADREIDFYSAFYDCHRIKSTGLHEWLQSRQITDLYICGIIMEYCPTLTALDAKILGYKTFFILNATVGLDLPIYPISEAIKRLIGAGVNIISYKQILT